MQGSHTDQHAPEPFFIPFPRCSFLLSFPFLPLFFLCSWSVPTTSPTHQEQSSSTTAADHLATVQASTAATDTRADRHKIHRRATAHARHVLDRFRAGRWAHPRPSGMPHSLSLAPSVPNRAPSPAMPWAYCPVKSWLHHDIGPPSRAAVAFSWTWFAQNINLL